MQIKSNLYSSTFSQTPKNFQTSKTKRCDEEKTSKTKRYDEEKIKNITGFVFVGALGGGLVGDLLGVIKASKKIESFSVENVRVSVKEPFYSGLIGAVVGGVMGGVFGTLLSEIYKSEAY